MQTISDPKSEYFPFFIFIFMGEAVSENPDLHIVDQATLEKARNRQQIFQAESVVKVRMAKVCNQRR